MKKLLMAAILVALAGTLGWSAPVCVTDTLANYEALGATGCTIGSMVFNNFSYSIPLQVGSVTLVADTAITVTPVLVGLNQTSLTFAGAFAADARGLVDYRVSYQVTSPLAEADLTLGSHLVPGTGNVNLTESIAPGSLNVFHDGGVPPTEQDFDSIDFYASGLSVVNDLEISGNTGGASLASFTNGFSVPEPLTMLLVGSGLLGLGLLRRRMRS